MENSFKLVFHFQINFEYAGELKESLFLLLTWWKFHVCENEKNLSHFKILKKKEPHLLKSWTTVNNFKLVFDFKLILNMQGILLIVESFMSLKMNGVFGGSIESIEMFFFFLLMFWSCTAPLSDREFNRQGWMSRLTTVLIYVLLVFNEVITSTQALYVKKEGISQRLSTSLVLPCVMRGSYRSTKRKKHCSSRR